MNIGHGIEEQIPIFLSQQYAHCCFSRELLLESCRNLQQKKLKIQGLGLLKFYLLIKPNRDMMKFKVDSKLGSRQNSTEKRCI